MIHGVRRRVIMHGERRVGEPSAEYRSSRVQAILQVVLRVVVLVTNTVPLQREMSWGPPLLEGTPTICPHPPGRQNSAHR